ncbi:hypothetical protein ACJX0J_022419, partial [Zea mays]
MESSNETKEENMVFSKIHMNFQTLQPETTGDKKNLGTFSGLLSLFRIRFNFTGTDYAKNSDYVEYKVPVFLKIDLFTDDLLEYYNCSHYLPHIFSKRHFYLLLKLIPFLGLVTLGDQGCNKLVL